MDNRLSNEVRLSSHGRNMSESTPVRVVLDTNVLVAAGRSRHGASFALVSSIPAPEFQPCLSVGLYAEWQGVLLRPGNPPPGRTPGDSPGFGPYLPSQSQLPGLPFLWRPLPRAAAGV